MSTIPTADYADRADQFTPILADDQGADMDLVASNPLAERIRRAFDDADLADRIDQSISTPLPDEDDYPLAY
ncbi:hypothetical protein IU443_01565 [Nocardia farcinica]|uniref:Uncharacterized protein n=1 Tax=Nocardia farcinica TaxID=37329 RepID=A0A0H5NHJ6_NOCFR|nr:MULTISPECIES: hypothetical protein [Nocardia]AXK84573.1 hypothetical protein DXT66_01960 [Nocardia farcinica]MBA4854207.1 hypothetical protein [Nocardia farcinica]MBC9814392.1 hypothetical protein [Nocardia farcinica]MBF6069865.1 hypothetical protein [Nocardia farcinica]MBF6139376.1 hypothetical protein [Nocardia farcinica]